MVNPKILDKNQDLIKIGVSYDSVTLHHQDFEMYINQEDDVAAKLKKLFEHLGYSVEIIEDY